MFRHFKIVACSEFHNYIRKFKIMKPIQKKKIKVSAIAGINTTGVPGNQGCSGQN